MPLIFGAATGDDVTISMSMTTLASDTAFMVTGWWMPTTLTSTRGLWSAGNIHGAEINTTTSELRLRVDHLTTNGEWTTTGVGLTLNQWQFLAFVVSALDTGPTVAWRVWSGTIATPPVEVTVTSAVAPVGNVVSGGYFYIGNKGTGTLAFRGEIANVQGMNIKGTSGTNILNIESHGTITNDEAAFIESRVVIPAWKGDYSWSLIRRNGNLGVAELNFASLDVLCSVPLSSTRTLPDSALTNPSTSVTVNGATNSATRCPRGNHNLIAAPIRR